MQIRLEKGAEQVGLAVMLQDLIAHFPGLVRFSRVMSVHESPECSPGEQNRLLRNRHFLNFFLKAARLTNPQPSSRAVVGSGTGTGAGGCSEPA